MKPSMLDTDILSGFLRGNPKVIEKVGEHLKEYGFVSLSIITYYEILNGLLYKDAKKQLLQFACRCRAIKPMPCNTVVLEVFVNKINLVYFSVLAFWWQENFSEWTQY
jgi:hypothetical protein